MAHSSTQPPSGPGATLVPPTLAGLARRIVAWRAKQHASPAWTAAVAIILGLMLLPVAAILMLALAPGHNVWPHLASTVLPAALASTLLLCLGTGLATLTVGVGAAWVVTM